MEKEKVTKKNKKLNKSRVFILCLFAFTILVMVINIVIMIIEAYKIKEMNDEYIKEIEQYANIVDEEVSKYMNDNKGEIPVWKDIAEGINEKNSSVKCGIIINYDGSVYMDNCTVDDLEYTSNYKYGKKLEEKETEDEIYTYYFDFVNEYLISKIKRYSNYYTLLDTYKCKSTSCKVLDSFTNDNKILINDDKIYIYDFKTKENKEIVIENTQIKEAKFVITDNKLVALTIKNDKDKIAIYNLENNKLITDFEYDGVSVWNEEGLDNYIALFINDSKYNQILKLIVSDGTILKEHVHCIGLKDNTSEGRCNTHVHGTITKEEVDNVLDRVLRDYPDLSFERLYMIKNAVETVGLPYLWGGGHATMENALYIAEEIWNNQYCMVWAEGSQRQLPGTSHPCGLDCSGFVRWVIYTVNGVDVFSKGTNIIGGRNQFVTLIDEKDKLPGDIVMDSDHVVIYLYTDDETGRNVYVHSALREYKVQISEYNKNVKFYRLNEWV